MSTVFENPTSLVFNFLILDDANCLRLNFECILA